MKKIISKFLMVMLMMQCMPAMSQTSGPKTQAPVKLEAYYFHLTSRCVTCKAVEAEARKNLESLYGSKVTFQSINLEDSANSKLVEKLGISGQTLLIVRGEKQINLTNEGFLYARNNPEKFKVIIREKVDGLLKL